ELLKEQHLLISKHTRRYLRQEHYFPGAVIDRASHERWQEQGSLSSAERVRSEMERLIAEYEPSSLSSESKKELAGIMESEGRRSGMEKLPEVVK
ncbi:MAG TPA: trimethylamine methyltransferase family protein, partial [Candidatus Kapabacteria bacterium]|nr:trimethylamine methyltransferase family protein [Candidatus Kapabacteria bacterium]